MSATPRYRVAICGCGIAGTTVAFLLAEQGHDVVLFEQAPKCGPVGAGILLQPSGQAVLEQLGLLAQVAASSATIRCLHAVTARGRQLIQLPYAELGDDMYALGVHRGHLFRVLHQRCLAAGVAIHEDHKILRRWAVKNEVFIADTHDRRHGPFDFVIATDGSRSQLRTTGGLHVRTRPYRYAALWFVGTNHQITDKLYQVVRGTGALAGLLPTGNDRCSLFWGVREDRWPQLREKSLASWKRDVIDLCPAAVETLDEINSFADLTFATYQHVWMPRWHDDHMVFLGDAAHAMSPHLGQGVNLALIDALTFADAVRESASLHEAIRQYEIRRRNTVQFYWRLTRFLTPFFQSDGYIRGWGRDLFLPIMPRVPWLRRQMLRTMAGIKSDWFGL